jgi:hypothetical protein
MNGGCGTTTHTAAPLRASSFETSDRKRKMEKPRFAQSVLFKLGDDAASAQPERRSGFSDHNPGQSDLHISPAHAIGATSKY